MTYEPWQEGLGKYDDWPEEVIAKFRDLIPPPQSRKYQDKFMFNAIVQISARMGWMKFSDFEINQKYHSLKSTLHKLKETTKRCEADLEQYEKDYEAPRARVPDIPL